MRDLATAVDYTLRKHGKNIIGKQFASARLADMMIDLFVLASTLSRVSTAVQEKGAAQVTRELEILEVFTQAAKRRFKSNFEQMTDNNDELVKSLANHALDLDGYTWDNVK
jgi:alkylation response protein AidB-like acyl-CoA dehydrogenase